MLECSARTAQVHGDARFTEDLREAARQTYNLADRLCGSCKNLHLLWPYLRLAQASGGDVDNPLVCSVLGRLLAPHGRSVLIAGCADAGLLALVARTADSSTNITVLDRCAAPLEVCRRFADRWSLSIEIIHLNLTELTLESRFDVVFAHMLLHLIPPDQCLDVLARMRRSLRSDGRLVLVFRSSARIEGSFLPEYRRGYALHLIEALEAAGIDLPEPRETFRRRIEVYAEERRAWEGAHADRAEVEQLLTTAGFVIANIVPIESVVSPPYRRFNARIGLRRYLAVAAPADAK
jgi:SAM-dependent methyltransferase